MQLDAFKHWFPWVAAGFLACCLSSIYANPGSEDTLRSPSIFSQLSDDAPCQFGQSSGGCDKVLGVSNALESSTFTMRAHHLFSHTEASVAFSMTPGRAGIPEGHSVLFGLSFNLSNNKPDDKKDYFPEMQPIEIFPRPKKIIIKKENKVARIQPVSIPDQTIRSGSKMPTLDMRNYFSFKPNQFEMVKYTLVAPESSHLLLVQEDAYDANLMSLKPMMKQLSSGGFPVTIEAMGIKNGRVMIADNRFNIHVIVGHSNNVQFCQIHSQKPILLAFQPKIKNCCVFA